MSFTEETYHKLQGKIESCSMHKKVYKILIKDDQKSKIETIIFRTDLSTRIQQITRKIIRHVIEEHKKEDETQKIWQNMEKTTYIQYKNMRENIENAYLFFAKKIPLFLPHSKIHSCCVSFNGTWCIKLFSLQPPFTHNKTDIRKWSQPLHKWLKDQKTQVHENSIINDTLQQTYNIINQIHFFGISIDKHDDEKNDHIIKLLHKKYPDNIIFNCYMEIITRLDIINILENHLTNSPHPLPFSPYDVTQLAEYCADFHDFVKDPYMQYMINNNGGKRDIDIIEKYAASQDFPMIHRIHYNIYMAIEKHMYTNGHTCIPLDYVKKSVKEQMEDYLITHDQEKAFYHFDIIKHARESKYFYNITFNNIEWIYLRKIWDREQYIISTLQEWISHQNENNIYNETKEKEIQDYISDFEIKTSRQLNTHQIQCVINTLCVDIGINILTGFPGTGKSLVINCIHHICEKYLAKKISICAPTGKAAQRIGDEACTVHRLLETTMAENKIGLEPGEEIIGPFIFKRHMLNPLETDVLIIDETSMLDFTMFYALLKACHNIPISVLIVGDHNQLPSVGYGNILQSLIACRKIPVIHLKHIYRQAEGSTISLLSRYIVKGITPALDILNDGIETIYIKTSEVEHIIKKINELYEKYENDIIIISPMKVGQCGTNIINKSIHEKIAEKRNVRFVPPFFKKERIIINTNYYVKKLDDIDMDNSAFNGDIGFYEHEENDFSDALVNVNIYKKNILKNITVERNIVELGHACTIHKMQGAEHPVIILLMHKSQIHMLNKKLFYTAITRAKKKVYIISDDVTITKATQKNAEERFELLSHFI